MQGRIHYGMCHAKHCTQHTVLHFALQRSKKQDEQAAVGPRSLG
jgi:hypothetical protein